MRVSPSAVSQQLAALQAGVPVPLTVRRGRALVLTEAGEAVAVAGARVEEAMAAARDAVDAFLGDGDRVVSVSAFHSAGHALFGPLLGALVDGPRVSLRDADVAQDDFAGLTADHDLVVAHRLAHHPAWPAQRLAVVPLFVEPLDVALPSDHPLAAQPALAPEQLADEPWIAVHDGFRSGARSTCSPPGRAGRCGSRTASTSCSWPRRSCAAVPRSRSCRASPPRRSPWTGWSCARSRGRRRSATSTSWRDRTRWRCDRCARSSQRSAPWPRSARRTRLGPLDLALVFCKCERRPLPDRGRRSPLMPTMFVNLPVTDLERAKAFYEAVGFRINPLFTDHNAACVVVEEDHSFFMILTPRVSSSR